MDIKKASVAFGLMAAVCAGAAKYEAEAASLSGDAVANGSYVSMKTGNISFSVNESTAGKYTLTFHYMADSKKINDIKINGASAGSVTFPQASTFTDVSTIVNLNAGANTLEIVKNWGWIDLDYIELTPFEVGSFNLCNAPTTENATASAVKLYNFLVNNFGQKTISGVMTGEMNNYTIGDVTKHEDVLAVYNAGGKYPALVGVDLLNATGATKDESWNKGYTQKAIDIAKSIWIKGGIPAITWHWRPGNETQFYTESANRSEGFTNFDFTNAFMTGTTTWDTLSTTYQTLVADIDTVAGYMLELQEEGVAAIFRPLHESGGNWFWWSSHTGAQFAALYRLVYERLVFKKGVKNLIWVFNPQDASMTDWDPGSTYYDVLGIDIYNKANDHSSNYSAFFDLMLKFGTDKVLALSENGPIPDVTNMHNDGAIWSWWMPWYESWNGGYVSQTAASVWQTNLTNENIITLDKMPGWANYGTANSGTKTCNTSTEASTYNGDKDKASGDYKNYLMQVSLSNLGKSGALIEYTKLPDLTSSKSISVKISTKGSGAVKGGIWIGLAFVRDSLWTWEQSTSNDCWIEEGKSKTCEFEITTYVGEDEKEHPIDLDDLFSVAFNISAEGFSGNIGFDEMVTDNGLIISNFDKEADLFARSKGSETVITAIQMVENLSEPAVTPTSSSSNNPTSGNSNTAIGAGALPAGASMTLQGSSISFTAVHTGNVSLDVFDLQGNRVATLYRGVLSAGTHQFSLTGIARGSYIVRAKGAGFAVTKQVIIR